MFSFSKAFRQRSRQAVLVFAAGAILLAATGNVNSQRRRKLQNPTSGDPVSKILLLQILRAEDERRWDDELRGLFSARNARVRERAALAAGRIGSEAAVPELIRVLQHDDENFVRVMAAFALGEIESPLGADALIAVLKDGNQVAARAVEALGKITAALPKEQEARSRQLAAAVLEALTLEATRRPVPDETTILLALTAVLRAKPENAGSVVAGFLDHPNPRVRADAANILARLKLQDGNEQLRKLLTSDPDPVVRANAARVLGATEDKASFEVLLDRALKDKDSRVRVSAIRALASLKNDRAATPLLERGEQLLPAAQTSQAVQFPSETNEILEIATAIGRLLQTSKNARAHAVRWLQHLRTKLELSLEVEVAFARVSPQLYQIAAVTSISPPLVPTTEGVSVYAGTSWGRWASVGQGLAELALVKSDNPMLDANIKEQAINALRDALACPPYSKSLRNYRYKAGDIVTVRCVPMPRQAVPDFLRALAAFKPMDREEVLRKHLKDSDVVVRGTAADLLGELPPDDTNARALIDALPVALADKQLNDAALSILDALAKQKSTKANEAIKTALDSRDYLIRRKAVAVLKENGAGDFSARIGTVQTSNTRADYERAMARMGKQVTAVVTTTKGSFTIKLLPDEATLTVDNFVQLAKRKYFNGISVHRVVPNFVMQDGDPRGDGNGGPGYQIRCEINEAHYNRAAVGMALSGKDTGGSQWFITHSPQPHLDGGYTVFGNVVSGMEVVDTIARGDVIRSIVINESVVRRNNHRQ